ncbi:YkgJ family cysteine cluster protein [Dissulfurirhabdus thermomarina]|uniref:YkgJ family cysteine cluster protein n=1 Tax=Dissulfurirhabdus thermomarina TaxID=1765737 RepID=A0A6N9TVC4_DISTH|nr:YkgJ family cysteine cluster protein [Dissulfurirhabdus thermomarina]NDY42446.1 YkgJ family cysteine cluster protein [Dissulfurirhabdus thermomarina]NMX23382.1 YkgJ family cysteine cluster protein [Dissulfurirhabdus thermomarina]
MYAPKDRPQVLVPVRLDLDSTFTFACRKGMPCFTRCCRDAGIMLTPYDVIRLKRRLELPSDEFLAIYTVPGHIENTELPIPVLKMLDDEHKTCPFLGDEGCKIYDDRPSTCRYYPIGAGIFHNHDAAGNERFFALVKEGHCLGHDEAQEWTVAQWREDQGLAAYDEVNTGWVELILRRKSLGPFTNIPDKTLQMFFLGSYNVDAFRRFVEESAFLRIYDVPGDRLAAVREDDVAALHLAMDWLKTTLFGEGLLRLRGQVAEAREVEA